MRRALVSGACGSIGSALVERLLNDGLVVCALDNNEDGLFQLKQTYSTTDFLPRLKIFLGDVRDMDRVTQAMDKVNDVYHCAALKHVELSEYNPFEAMKTNIQGTNNVIQSAIKAQVDKVIVTSSDKAVNPSGTMGVSKLFAEKLTISANNHSGSSGVRFGCVRFGNVWNTNGSVGRIFKDQILTGNDIGITDSQMTRFFISRAAAVDLCINACSQLIGGEIFVSDMGATSIGKIASEFLKFNKEAKVNEIGPKPGEKFYEELFTDVESFRTYISSGLYIVLPDCLEKDLKVYTQLRDQYISGDPVSQALRSNSPIAKKIDPAALVNEIMNET